MSDEQQGGNDAGNVRPMSTLSGSNSDEDQDTGQTLPNSKRRRRQLQSPNHSCNVSTDNESANERTLLHALMYQHRCELYVVKEYADAALAYVVAELVT